MLIVAKFDFFEYKGQDASKKRTNRLDLSIAKMKDGRHPSRPDWWVVDGKVYDLTPFLDRHPGGRIFLDFMRGRDATAQVYTYHPTPDRVLAVLQKYQIGTLALAQHSLAFRSSLKDQDAGEVIQRASDGNPSDLLPMPLPSLVPPPFLFPELDGARGFGAALLVRSRQVRFDSPLLREIKNHLAQPATRAEIHRADSLYNLSTLAIAVVFLLVWGWALLYRPPLFSLIGVLWMLAISALRTSLAGAGHYYLHQPANWWTQILEQLFETNYVAVSCVQRDGHTILHHAHTKTAIDSKDLGTTGFVMLPLFYRFPAHTLHKLGQLVSGAFVRQCIVFQEMYNSFNWLSRPTTPRSSTPFTAPKPLRVLTLFLARILFWIELGLFISASLFPLWLAQFVFCLWYNTAVLMANHDYHHPKPLCKTLALHEREGGKHDNGTDGNDTKAAREDWAADQISCTSDLKVTGCRWVDVWLTAGLSPHRVHHLLPYQHSAYANLVSEAVVKKVCGKRGIEWLPPTNFWTTALPSFINNYMFVPAMLFPRQMLARGSVEVPTNDENHSCKLSTSVYPIYPSLWQEHFSRAALSKTITHVLEGFTGVAI